MGSASCTETGIKKQHLYSAIWDAWHLEAKAAVSSSSRIWSLCSIGFWIVFIEVGKCSVWFPDLEKGRHRKLRRRVSRDRGKIQVLWLLFLCHNCNVLSHLRGSVVSFQNILLSVWQSSGMPYLPKFSARKGKHPWEYIQKQAYNSNLRVVWNDILTECQAMGGEVMRPDWQM